MAIRNRHGIYDKFIPEKLVPGEFAFVRSGDPNAKDGKAIYASFDAGTTKRLATYEDMKENIALAADDVVNEVAEELNAATDRANTSAVEAETAAMDATNAAEEAKHAIAGSKSPVYKSDGWPEVGEEGRLYIDDTVSPRLIYTWDDEDGYVKTGGSVGGNATVEEMTWAEYEALSEAEKMDGTLRVITDKKAGVRFGNVDISGIGDGTVTGAISAINSNLSDSIQGGDSYVKFSDGTLICYGMVAFPPFEEGVQQVVVSFPYAFTSQPRVTISWQDTNKIAAYFGQVWVDYEETTGSVLMANGDRKNSGGGNWYASYIAIGRWK
jgi:hypothetical protein